MIKSIFCLLFGLSIWQPAFAQTTPAPAPTELSAGRRDTLNAISNLFDRRRKGGKRWAYVGVAGGLAMVRALTAAPETNNSYGSTSTASSSDASGLALIAGVFLGVPAAASIGNLVRYSEKREEAVARAYRSGQPLPNDIRRRLKKKDFLSN